MKEILKISLREAPILGATAKSYLSGKCPELISFFQDEKGIREAIEKRKTAEVDRSVLVTVLAKQNKNAGAKVLKNVESLKNVNSFTVTTGHQLCLFTGPLYFIYKILHTIKLSEELNTKFSENHFVPVYWMASEDHDFAEVNHAYVYGKKVEWKTEVRGAVGRVSSRADRIQPPGLDSVLSELKSILGDSPKAQEIFLVMEKCYAKENLAQATRALVEYLFSDYGLVIMDADEPRWKQLFAPVMIKEIREEFVFSSVTATNKLLEAKNLKTQVTPRAINLFYLSPDFRDRIIREGENYTTADGSKKWTTSEILKELEQHPENFSPNVLMRALYQETILPNIAYIGGGGEISYWLQMKKMFDAANVFFPALVVRNSFLLIDSGQFEKWNKLGFQTEDLFKTEEELIKDFITRNASDGIDFSGEQEDLKKAFHSVAEKMAKADATLKATAEAELQKAVKSLEMLEAKMRKAEKARHEQSLNQIRQIKNKLFPEGEFQERHDNFLQYWVKTEGSFVGDSYQKMMGIESQLNIQLL